MFQNSKTNRKKLAARLFDMMKALKCKRDYGMKLKGIKNNRES
jgi:hypothetical protein